VLWARDKYLRYEMAESNIAKISKNYNKTVFLQKLNNE
jgi:hypothetical protein